MINDLIRALREAGVTVPATAAESVECYVRERYGGCQIYIARHPKRRHQVRLKKVKAVIKKQADQAAELGISVRQLRRIERGK